MPKPYRVALMGEIAARRSPSMAKLAQPVLLVGIIRCDASAARGRFSTRAIGASISLSALIYDYQQWARPAPCAPPSCTIRRDLFAKAGCDLEIDQEGTP
jgi:hypothetical protein